MDEQSAESKEEEVITWHARLSTEPIWPIPT